VTEVSSNGLDRVGVSHTFIVFFRTPDDGLAPKHRNPDSVKLLIGRGQNVKQKTNANTRLKRIIQLSPYSMVSKSMRFKLAEKEHT
jgi:hypothetical protein